MSPANYRTGAKTHAAERRGQYAGAPLQPSRTTAIRLLKASNFLPDTFNNRVAGDTSALDR